MLTFVSLNREHLLDVRDIGFTHALYEVKTGDRMWVHWRQSETKSTTSHSILVKRVCQLDDDVSTPEHVVSFTINCQLEFKEKNTLKIFVA